MNLFTLRFLFLIGSFGLLLGCTTSSGQRSCKVKTELHQSGNFEADLSIYSGEVESSKSIIIFPPTGGTNLIDRSYAREFCTNGFDVIILNSWTGQNEKSIELELHQRFYSRAQTALNLALTKTKSSFVGLLGTSVGALHASVAAATNERIKAVFAITGGVPIAEVVVLSDQKAMIDLKDARKKQFNLKTDDEIIAEISKVFHLEPMLQGELYRTKDLGVAIAAEDSTVPTDNQKKLVEFWKPKKIITLSNSHFWGIVNTWLFHTEEIIEFFQMSSNK